MIIKLLKSIDINISNISKNIRTLNNYIYNYLAKTNNSIIAISCCLLLLTACSSNKRQLNPQDPLEPINRVSYQFNKTVDALYLNPAVQVYTKSLPGSFRRLITNFFNNVSEVPAIFNLLLQSRSDEAMQTAARFSLNSTLGLGGLFDVAAKHAKLTRVKTDFGATLYNWGYQKSAYIVLPLLGPTTIRDGIGLAANNFISPNYYLKPKYRNAYSLAYMVSKKSDLNEVKDFITAAGVDEYILMRNSYLQNRNYNLGINDSEEEQ